MPSRLPALLASSLLASSMLAPFAAAAVADDRPPSMPLHDATVLYDVHAHNQNQVKVRVYFGHGGDLLRVDGPDGQGDTVLDRATGTLTIVINPVRAYMVIPSKGPIKDPFLLDPAAQYQRVGTTQVIAGLPCADWRITSSKGAATACVTDDGLLLQASGVDGAGASGEVRALDVSAQPLAASLFLPPAGYQRVAHPGQPQP